LKGRKKRGGGGDPPPSSFSATDGQRRTVVQPTFFADLQHWVRADSRIAARILELVAEVERDPFRGKGKPEPLKHAWRGHWSRRIDTEHRLIYRVHADHVELVSARDHT
jgi:toxin YoeB